jgi:hypothetical protein
MHLADEVLSIAEWCHRIYDEQMLWTLIPQQGGWAQ